MDVWKEYYIKENYPAYWNNPQIVELLEAAVEFKLLKNLDDLYKQFEQFRQDFTQFINGKHWSGGSLDKGDSYYFNILEKKKIKIGQAERIVEEYILKIRLSNHLNPNSNTSVTRVNHPRT